MEKSGVWRIIPNRGAWIQLTPCQTTLRWQTHLSGEVSRERKVQEAILHGMPNEDAVRVRALVNVQTCVSELTVSRVSSLLFVFARIVFRGLDSLTLVYDQAVCSLPPPHVIYNGGQQPFNLASHHLRPQSFSQACLSASLKPVQVNLHKHSISHSIGFGITVQKV